MDVCFDTEFHDGGREIGLISVGLAAADGRTYYAVAAEAGDDPLYGRIVRHPWLMANVVPHLPLRGDGNRRPRVIPPTADEPGEFLLDTAHPDVKPRTLIADQVEEFLRATPDPRLWANCGAHDFLALTQLRGPLVAKSDCMPWHYNELQQEIARLGEPVVPPQRLSRHHALGDALHNLAVLNALHPITAGGSA